MGSSNPTILAAPKLLCCCLNGASLVGLLVKNPPAIQETLVQFLGGEDPLEKDRLSTPVFLGFPGGSDGKESTCNVGDLGWIPGLGRSPGGGHGNPLQYSCLENPTGRGAWRATAHGVRKSLYDQETKQALLTASLLCIPHCIKRIVRECFDSLKCRTSQSEKSN